MGDYWEQAFMNSKDLQEHIEKHGFSGIEEILKNELGRWKDVEINIGVTGNVGVGKSSFINAIKGLEDEDDDDDAAETGVAETTKKPTSYSHPTNPKITFWDLPGIGTTNYPDIPTYYAKVGLERFDTFLILSAGPFTQNDADLARKVEGDLKSFFFVRTKVDSDYVAQRKRRKKTFNEEVMLQEMRADCKKNLPADKKVFLISSLYPARWDFARLTQAILDDLPFRQKECLTLSLGVLTSLSTDMLKRKADILRGRIWMVASSSAAAAVVPLSGLSLAVDFTLIKNEVDLYISQLGLPAADSEEFQRLNPEFKEKVRKFRQSTSVAKLATLISSCVVEKIIEEPRRFDRFVGPAIAGGISFSYTYCFLRDCLNEFQQTALAVLKEKATRAANDF